MPWAGDSNAYMAEIEEFLTGQRSQPRKDRVLTTILVTDLVASTERAAACGDEAWREIMARHDVLVADQLRWFGGQQVKHTGDGILPRSTARPAPSVVPRPLSGRHVTSWSSTCAPVFTPGRSRLSTRTCED